MLDEAEALPWVLGRMPRGFEPLVVDNGSSDGSAADRREPRRARDRGADARASERRAGPVWKRPARSSSASWTVTARSTPASSRASRPR